MTTRNELQKRRTRLSEAKLDLLEKRLHAKEIVSPTTQTIPKRLGDAPAPLSSAQQRLWFIEQLEPGTALYTISRLLRLRGTVQVSALERSFQLVIQRHESLRTTFTSQQGVPQQVIHPQIAWQLPLIDLSGLAEFERALTAPQLLQQTLAQPFDLEQGPLLRAVLLRLQPDEHVLVYSLHHIITDGWSMEILQQEIALCYAALIVGEPVAWPPPPIQYADFALWQRSWLQGAVLEQQLAYWRERLADLEPLDFPSDMPRSAVRSSAGSQQEILLPADLVQQIKALSQRTGTTLFMSLLTCFQILLARYSGQHDIAVGTPIANRTRMELEGVIGCFVNTLVIRTRLTGQESFEQLLEQVKEGTLGAYMHQDVPFEKIVEELHPERDLSRSPLIQVLFVMQNTLRTEQGIEGITIEPIGAESDTAKFDLTLSISETQEGLLCHMEYATALFHAFTIQRMLQHWRLIVEEIIKHPSRQICSLSLISAAERQQILYDWNVLQIEQSPDQLLHQRFEREVQAHPDAIAVVYEQAALTYGELNARANQLAHYLRAHGAGPESLIGICLYPGLEMLVGLLGILKAGGAYVPLDPSYPVERQSFMLADARVLLLLTQQALSGTLPSQELPALCLDTDWPLLACESKHNLNSGATAGNLAYVIYTSGSTGEPKGVMVSHANVLRLFTATQERFQFDQSDIWTLFHSFAFDFSVWEIWGALLYGGRLIMVPYTVSREPERFAALLATQSVTILNQTPSAFRQLVWLEKECEWVKGLALRRIIFGGEALDAQSVQMWFERYGEVEPQLVNMYGITETTVHVTYRPLDSTDVERTTNSRIGRPLADLEIYVLDEYLQPVPIGVPGEMYVGAAGLARGYLRRPQLTSERFIPHPFSIRPGARLYKTGDKACFRPDSTLEYLGRIDQQVKIRGFRIELGEIEALLGLLPEIETCVVIVREDLLGEKRLVAYVVFRADFSLSTGELRRALLEKLPEYMVPAVFIQLKSLPLTTQGKLDRRALPVPDQSRPDLEAPYMPPQTPTEEILALVWASALGLEQVGIHDNFFALGGDSIRSIQVLAQARQHGLHFTLQQLFQYQTIAQLSHVLVEAELSKFQIEQVQPGSLIAAEDWLKRPEDVEDAYPLARLQAGMLFHSQYDVDFALYHDLMSYHLQVPLNLEAMQTVLQLMVRRHDILRTSFDLDTFREPLQLVHREGAVLLQMTDLRGYQPEEQEAYLARWLEEQEHQPFDWTHAPLLRFYIHVRSERSFQLTMNCHHAILDGWSVASLLMELITLYLTTLDGQALPVEVPFKAHYRDFIAIEQQLLKSGEAQQYWQRTLDGSTLLVLPFWVQANWKKERTTSSEFQVPIAQELSDRLNQLAQKLAVPIKSLLLAVHLKVLSVLGGQADVLTGLVCNGRLEVPDGERLLGLFLNTLPLRLKLQQETWVDLIQRVFAAECEMLPYRWYPLAEIQRQEGGHNLFESLFTFTRFHVYSALAKIKQLQVLSASAVARTNFALDINFSQDVLSSQIRLVIACNLNHAYPAQVEMLTGYYTSALNALADHPYASYTQQSLLSPMEIQRILVEWNDTHEEYPRDTFIHTLIEQQAERTPDAVAVVYESEYLTYAQLNRRANQLAHYLQSLGVGPEVLVGICMERSLALIVGMLGTLKAGGAYVPLDPSSPAERLATMLADSAVPLLLTQQRVASRLPVQNAVMICLDSGWEHITSASQDTPLSSLRPGNLAYIIYTSGSTGIPKGVLVPHANLVNAYFAWEKAYHLRSQCTTYLQMANFSFDVFTGDVVRALGSGGKLVLCAQELLLDAGQLFALMKREQVDIAEFVPVVLRNLLIFLKESGQLLDFMRVLLVGSDSWYSKEHQEVRQFCGPQTYLVNSYGVTEATIDSAYFAGSLSEEQDERMVPIGRPFMNTQLYILDEHLYPAPMGVVGELYIGGEGIARGYQQRPELTAERFLPDPFSDSPGTRMYRTGDIVRYLPGGDLEFLGRRDAQVKVRGYRIELGEIETVLNQHPDVQDAVVIVREEMPQAKTLVAYIVLRGAEEASSTSTYRRYLKENLPNYMVPSRIVLLEKLPLLFNGKIDRRALPAPEQLQNEKHEQPAAPRTSFEELLAGIWRQCLGDVQIGIHDNFFDLGGHSLVATQLMSRVRSELQVEMPLRSLFEYPTIAGLAQQVERFIREKQGIQAPVIRPAVRGSEAPLSFAQQRLWFLDQLEPGSTAYLIPGALRLHGALDARALEWSLQELVRRHESLRTTFAEREGQPIQVIWPDETFSLPIRDLRSLGQREREEETQRLIEQEVRQPCDLARGPLLRTMLIRLENEEHVLLLILHHIVFDAWSDEILRRELAALYGAALAGQSSPLPSLPIQYADFAIWQRQWLQGSILEAQLNYWKKQLQGAPAFLDLPTDYPRPVQQTFRGRSLTFSLPQALLQALERLGQQEGTTLFMTLLAAWQVLLSRYTGQEDIVVGIPVANRTQLEMENLIGFFVNTLALRTDLSGNPSFREVLRRVREVALEAYSHQDAPFEQVVEAVQPPRDASRSPLFQVMFSLENTTMASLDLPGLRVQAVDIEDQVAKFDLSLSLQSGSDSLSGVLEYNTDLFAEATIERMAQHFQIAIADIISNPEKRLADVLLLPPAEQHLLLVDWNSTRQPFPQKTTLHELFTTQAEATPTALAVIDGEQLLTYHELNQQANQLAHRLQQLGVGPETLVGLYLNRSCTQMVGVLAILKAGGAYLPLDVASPGIWLMATLQDAQVELVLTTTDLQANLEAYQGTVFCLDNQKAHLSSYPVTNPLVSATPANLAYVIYTSGSTGKPKGVQIEHRSIVNHCWAIMRHYHLSAVDRVAQFASLSFDAAAEELYPTWASGATLVLRPHDLATTIEEWHAWITEMRISVLDLPTAYWHYWVTGLNTSISLPSCLRLVIVGGERALPERYAQWQRVAGPQVQWSNTYGPTESTVTAVLTAPLTGTKEEHWRGGRVPIGRPLANLSAYVLDGQLEPVPVNVVGELYLGGMGVARGYMQCPDLTAERFLPDPYAQRVGERLYRTGDLARYRPDGILEYCGRSDQQVKIRGYRIELGEISAVLAQHPAVQGCVVVVREDSPGENYLVAYVAGSQIPARSVLRHFLQGRLPAYMVPAIFVVLPELPLTISGKIDVRALPAPDRENLERQRELVAPRNAVEEVLVRIWQELLGQTSISVEDNFFEMGGHSLLAIQLMARIDQVFSLVLPLRVLFETPTIANLAAFLLQAEQEYEQRLLTAHLFLKVEELSEEEIDALLRDAASE